MNKANFIRALRKGGTSLAINVPSEIIELLDLKEGIFLRVEIEKIDKK